MNDSRRNLGELAKAADRHEPAGDVGAWEPGTPDWQQIVDVIDTAIRVFDENDRLVAWNRAFAEIGGQPPMVLRAGMPHHEVLEQLAARGYYGNGDPADLAQKRLAAIQANRERGAPEEIALAPRSIRSRKRFWLDNGGQIATSRNLDQEKVIEQELATKSAILKTVFETLDQPVCVLDGQHRFIAWNEKFAAMAGLQDGDLHEGMHSRDVLLLCARSGHLGEGDPEELADKRYQELWTPRPASHEVIRRRGGRTFDVHRGHLPDGGIVSVFNDVSERELAAEELRQAKAQAETANAVKSDFLANMSHELRTPLNAILGFAELMMHSRFDNPQQYQEYAGDIRDSAVLLLNIINDLLDLSRIEAGKTEFRITVLELGECVDACLDLIKRTDGAASLTIERDIPENFPPVQLDENFLNQSLLNLLSNAVKATPDGGRITVSVRQVGDDRFSLCVADTGVGMPPETLKSVFNPYDSSGDSYVRKEKGTGLGLSIVKRLVDMLGGDVDIQSEVGRGTMVRLDLPLKLTG